MTTRFAIPAGRAAAALVLLAALPLAGCSGDELTRTFGLSRDAPE